MRCPREVHFKTFRKVELNDSLLLINGGHVVQIGNGKFGFHFGLPGEQFFSSGLTLAELFLAKSFFSFGSMIKS